MKQRLKEINWGIASRAGKTIYINKRLKSYPRLRKALLSHEEAHTDGFAMKDILLDINLEDLKGFRKEYYKFIITNPTSWVEYSPIKKYEGDILFNLPLLLIWLFFGGVSWAVLAAVL